MQRWLDIEAALALSQADLGMIPKEAADEIASAAHLEHIDLHQLREGIRRTGHSLVSLLEGLEEACPGGGGEYVHYGATTQDIQDTAQVLEMGEILAEVDRELHLLLLRLTELADGHRGTLMIGRTHAQPALPTTFGLKAASWLDELLRHGERLQALRPRIMVAELFGGVGTMAGFGASGPELIERFADRLSLGPPLVGWHVSRDRVADYVTTLAMVTASLARIAEDIRTLCRPELCELEEGWQRGRVGSSTMPHKRNPEGCEQIVVLARLCRATAALGLEGMIQEHERDSRGLRLEWVAVADVSHHTLAALAIMGPILQGLKVRTERMSSSAHQAVEAICTEALMLRIGRHVGKQSAHALVYDMSQAAQDQGRSLRDLLSTHPDIKRWFQPGELDMVFEPTRHLGAAETLVDRVVVEARRWLSSSHDADAPRAG